MTFNDVKAEFNARSAEVELYVKLLKSIDNGEVAIKKGEIKQVLPIGSMPVDAVKILKGASFLLVYNLVEAYVRRGFHTVFKHLEVGGHDGAALSNKFRAQWVAQRNKTVKAIDGSPKVYMNLAQELINDIVNAQVARMQPDRLPFSGNLDAKVIQDVFDDHGIVLRLTKSAKNGSSLALVKAKRNGLAHGDHSFATVGGEVSVADVEGIVVEVLSYMRDLLTSLESFAASQKYLR